MFCHSYHQLIESVMEMMISLATIMEIFSYLLILVYLLDHKMLLLFLLVHVDVVYYNLLTFSILEFFNFRKFYYILSFIKIYIVTILYFNKYHFKVLFNLLHK